MCSEMVVKMCSEMVVEMCSEMMGARASVNCF